MAELWDLLDGNRNPTGVTAVRGPVPDGYYHIVVDIWTLLPDGRLLLTRRNPDKPAFPGLWEGTAGSVIAGEDSLHGALRELREETGLRAEPEQLLFLGSEQTEHDFLDSYVYLCPDCDPKLTLQAEEVAEYTFVLPEEMDAWRERITPPAWKHFERDRAKISALLRERRD